MSEKAERPDKGTLAGRLRHAIDTREMSQKAVADAAGCSQGLIGQLLAGTTKTTAKLPEIARALRVRLDWLYFNHGGMDLDSEIPFDERTFLNVIESTVEAAQAGGGLSPREIARLALDVYESAICDQDRYNKDQISAIAPVLAKRYKRSRAGS